MSNAHISVSNLADHVGSEWGPSETFAMGQSDVDDFARLVNDYQWIHVDQERAEAGPFAGTIVHGFFALATCTRVLDAVVHVDGHAQAINYGLDRVRFPSALRVGSPVAGTVRLDSVTEVPGGVHAAYDITLAVKDSERPCMVARFLVRYLTSWANSTDAVKEQP